MNPKCEVTKSRKSKNDWNIKFSNVTEADVKVMAAALDAYAVDHPLSNGLFTLLTNAHVAELKGLTIDKDVKEGKF